jgi:adenylylsulfate kinase
VTGVVAWFTGRPAAGKSTLAQAVADRLRRRNVSVCVLDGDEVRAAMVPPVGYDTDSREGFYATLARLAALLAGQGLVVLVAATAHRRRHREAARQLAPRFVEVFVAATPDRCAQRDKKGLYRAAQRGDIDALPGVGVEYEEPAEPEFRAAGGHDRAATAALVEALTASAPKSGETPTQ